MQWTWGVGLASVQWCLWFYGSPIPSYVSITTDERKLHQERRVFPMFSFSLLFRLSSPATFVFHPSSETFSTICALYLFPFPPYQSSPSSLVTVVTLIKIPVSLACIHTGRILTACRNTVFNIADAICRHCTCFWGNIHGKVSARNVLYADYAACPPYPKELIEAYASDLLTKSYGNPHSEAGWMQPVSLRALDELRTKTLALCRADPSQYCCVLTSGATAALKMVGEVFPWSEKSAFLYLADNHTSVLGIRELAAARGASIAALDPKGVRILPSEEERKRTYRPPKNDGAGCHMFAFPLESNFSGVTYSERLVNAVHSGRARAMVGAMHWHTRRSPYGDESTLHVHAQASINTWDGVGVDGRVSIGPVDEDEGDFSPMRRGRWFVLLDAAKACSTHPPDLHRYPADFVALSYYKMFGFPTGLGALLIRRDVLPILRKTYFGGGTVLSLLAEESFCIRRPGPLGFEDGTPPFLLVPAALRGLQSFERSIGEGHVYGTGMKVACRLVQRLTSLCHGNGQRLAHIYGNWGIVEDSNARKCTPRSTVTSLRPSKAQQQQQEDHGCQQLGIGNGAHDAREDDETDDGDGIIDGQGPTVAFNLLDYHGNWVGHSKVQKVLAIEGIRVRSGVLCNPGACRAALGVTPSTMKHWYEEHGHVCWDDQDVIASEPTGVVRASFGYNSMEQDAADIVDCLARHFLVTASPDMDATSDVTLQHVADTRHDTLTTKALNASTTVRAQHLYIYPIKSCSGFEVSSWPMTCQGFLYDRHWAIFGGNNKLITLKTCPKLALIQPKIDLERGMLMLSAVGETEDISLSLERLHDGLHEGPHMPVSNGSDARPRTCCTLNESKVLGAVSHRSTANVSGLCSNDDERASLWLSEVLRMQCQLVDVHAAGSQSKSKKRNNFSNQAPLLALYDPSLRYLHALSRTHESMEMFMKRFRPNIVFGSALRQTREHSRLLNFASAKQMRGKKGQQKPYLEEDWIHLSSNTGLSLVVQGLCRRCEVICANPETGEIHGVEPLKTLARDRTNRNANKKFCFGVLMNAEICSSVDDPLRFIAVLEVGSLFEVATRCD